MLLQMFNDYSAVLVHSKLLEQDTVAAVLPTEDHYISLAWAASGDIMSYIFFPICFSNFVQDWDLY